LPEVLTAPLIAASLAIRSTSADNSSIAARSMRFIERPGMSQVRSAMPSASMSSLKLSPLMDVSVPLRHVAAREKFSDAFDDGRGAHARANAERHQRRRK